MTWVNNYEIEYGKYADEAAKKYGIPVTAFRNLIRSESSFNPTAQSTIPVKGEYASGIAQFLPSTAAGLGIDPFNPIVALDGAAKYLKELETKYGDLNTAIAKYKGYSDANLAAGLKVAEKITDTSIINNAGAYIKNESLKKTVESDGTFFGDARKWFIDSAQGIVLGFAGFVILFFTINSIYKKG